MPAPSVADVFDPGSLNDPLVAPPVTTSLGAVGAAGLASRAAGLFSSSAATSFSKASTCSCRSTIASARADVGSCISVPYKPGRSNCPVIPKPSDQVVVLPKAQTCEDKTRFLSGLDEAQGYPQPAHLRSHIAELRATVKAEMLELQC
jgi:hypothetical protein